MKVAFFNDARLKVDKQGVFSTTGGLTAALFKKYLGLCDSLIVVTRSENIDSEATANRSLSSLEGVTFNCVNRLNFNSLFRGEDRKVIKDTVMHVDFSIIRLPSIIGIFAYLECRRQRKPYLLEMVACPWDSLWYYGKIKYKFAAPVLYLANRYIVWNAAYVRYVSKSFLQTRYPTKGLKCACSDVQLKIFDKSILDKRIALIKRTNRLKISIGTVAPLHVSYKGQRYVIEAISRLSKQGYDIDYYLIGGGDSTKLLDFANKHGLKNKVHFMGVFPHDKIFDLMQNIDLYIQPSNAESHGRVVLEAFSVACPVIGSTTGGIPELVDKQCVFIRKNVKDLELKIKDIVAGKLEIQARRNFLEAKKYSPELLDARMQKFYFQAIKHATGARKV